MKRGFKSRSRSRNVGALRTRPRCARGHALAGSLAGFDLDQHVVEWPSVRRWRALEAFEVVEGADAHAIPDIAAVDHHPLDLGRDARERQPRLDPIGVLVALKSE